MKASFGRYVLLKKIAVGGMAEIFLARRLSFGGFAKFVVIKRLLPEHRARKAYEQLFLAEARITAVLDHPYVINVHDLGQLEDAYFIAMEYVHGVSAAEMMAMAARRRLKVPLAVALHIVRCVADALYYCDVTPDLDGEPLKVLHHDVSPHNVQIGFDGAVKLLDFGVATRMNMPAPGGRRGKYAYMSPEAISKRPLDPRSDLFSLGVCMFELCLGRRLFKGPTPDETKARATAGKIPRPTQVDPDCPVVLEEVILKALARKPEDRYPNGRALADAIAHAADTLGLQLSARQTRRWMEALHGEDVVVRRLTELRELARAVTPQSGGALHGTETVPRESEIELLAPEMSRAVLSAPPAVERTPSPEASQAPDEGPDLTLARAEMARAGSNVAMLAVDAASISELPLGVNDDDEDWDAMMSAPVSKWKRLSLLIAVVGMAAAAGAFFIGQAAGVSASESRMGVVRVESDPGQARVYDGNKLLGLTPFETAPAGMGTVFHLRIKKDGYTDWTGTISITPARRNRAVMVSLRKARDGG